MTAMPHHHEPQGFTMKRRPFFTDPPASL